MLKKVETMICLKLIIIFEMKIIFNIINYDEYIQKSIEEKE